MRERKRILLVTLTMIAVCSLSVMVTIGMLYVHDMNEHRQILTVTAQIQARMIEAVARYDSDSARDMAKARPGFDASKATLRQVLDAYGNYEGFGETGEFTLARQEGEEIVFLFRHRANDVSLPDSIPLDSDLAEPMRIVRDELNLVVGLISPTTKKDRHPSRQLRNCSTFMKSIRKSALENSQLPFRLKDAKGTIQKPASW